MWKKLEFRAGGPAPALPLRASRRPSSSCVIKADRPWGGQCLGLALLSEPQVSSAASILPVVCIICL